MAPKPRIIAAVAALLSLALGLALGAGRSDAGTPTQIEFWHAMSRYRGQVLETLVKRFNQENPDVVVQARFVGAANSRLGNDYNALYGKILEHLARGNPPDISQVYENWTTQLIEIGAIAPADGFFAGPNGLTPRELADFVPIFRQANVFKNDRLWTLPFNKSIYVLYYNLRLFREAGLQPPQTWDDFRTAASTISQKLGIPGLVFRPSVDIFGHYLYAYGGQYIRGDQASFGGTTGVDDLKYWVDLVHADRSARPAFDAEDQFKQGQSGMFLESSSRIGGFENVEGLDFGVAMLPMGSTRAYQFAGTNLAIFSRSAPDKQLAAWRFMKFMTSPEITAEWAIQTGYLPVRQSAIQGRMYQDFVREHPEYSVGVEALQYAVVQPRVPAWESIRGILDDMFFEALSRKYTSDDAIQRAVSLSNDLLESLQGR